eukprot:g27947.t1
MQTDTLLARHLSSPPPEPAVVLGATACQTMPLAVTLDSEGSLRLWDLKRGCKIARMSCEGPIDDPKQKADTEEDPEATVKPVIKLEQDETPKLLLSTATAFCAICMSMGANEEHVEVEGGAEDEGAEAPEADAEGHRKARALVILVALAGQEHTALLKLRHNTENPYSSKQNLFSNLDGRTDLGLFSSIKALALRISPSANETFRVLRPVQVLKKLFPSLPKGDVAKSFEALSKEELAKLQPQGVPSTMEKATLLSKKKPPEDPAARAPGCLYFPTHLPRTRLMSRSRSKLDTSNIMIMKLTAENLRKFAAAQAAQQEAAGGAKKVASSFGSAGFARSATLNTADRQKAEEAILPHGVPKNWQA